MIKQSAILLAIITLFCQPVLARGGPGAAGGHGFSAAGAPGQVPATLPAFPNQALINNPGFDTQAKFNDPQSSFADSQANISLEKRDFDLPLDNPGNPLSLLAQPNAAANHGIGSAGRANPADIGPGVQTHNGAIQRALATDLEDFSNPLNNPGWARRDASEAVSENNASTPSRPDSQNDYVKSDNNQRVMKRFEGIAEKDLPPGILVRQAALAAAPGEFSNPLNTAEPSAHTNPSLDDEMYNPFAENAKGKAKDKAKKKAKKNTKNKKKAK